MVENMDHHIGRLMNYLKSIGEYDNTLFIFSPTTARKGLILGQ